MEFVRATTEEFEAVIALFRDHDFALRERAWFDWKHLRNPFAGPHVYMVFHEGEPAGTVALLPQAFHHGARRLTAVQAVDGLTGRAIRGRGFFNEMMALVLGTDPDEADGPCFRLGYASVEPSRKALLHAGWRQLSDMAIRLAPLSARTLRALPGGALLSRLLAPLWPLVRARLCAGADDTLDIVEIDRFDADLDHLQPADRVRGDRSAAYLNWRVFDNPRDGLRAFLFRRDGRTVGYAICKPGPTSWEVLELRSADPGRGAAAAFLRHLHREGLTDAVGFWVFDGFRQDDKLPRGLRERRTGGAMFVHGHEAAGLPDDPARWAASYLDSDW